MRYREGYDINKWVANEALHRRRSPTLRWVLLAGLGLALAMPAFVMLGGADDRGPASILPYLPLLIGFGRSPFARDSWASSRGLDSFDEFERDVLARATRHAYTAFTLTVSVAAAWLWAAAYWDLPTPVGVHQWSSCFFTLFFAGFALPVVLAEWMVPLPPSLDDLED